ncbi:MAG: hypothetical protein A2901_05690 [Elusimicrobia bacterium RIFCSPLOWO2_01_FULL_54_10]|nr:MAG: hypothetical protein A2901_05690 [Elusimicrobia bacterium RIFCSPLOWO2_01_FULL_54_10]
MGAEIVKISEGSPAGEFSPPQLLAQTTVNILGEVVYIVFALAKRDIEHELALGSVIEPKGREF